MTLSNKFIGTFQSFGVIKRSTVVKFERCECQSCLPKYSADNITRAVLEIISNIVKVNNNHVSSFAIRFMQLAYGSLFSIISR